MNVLPWGGPTLRAAAAIKVPVAQGFRPLVPLQAVGLLFAGRRVVAGTARERRLAVAAAVGARDVGAVQHEVALSDAARALRRPDRFWINVLITVAVLGR